MDYHCYWCAQAYDSIITILRREKQRQTHRRSTQLAADYLIIVIPLFYLIFCHVFRRSVMFLTMLTNVNKVTTQSMFKEQIIFIFHFSFLIFHFSFFQQLQLCPQMLHRHLFCRQGDQSSTTSENFATFVQRSLKRHCQLTNIKQIRSRVMRFEIASVI